MWAGNVNRKNLKKKNNTMSIGNYTSWVDSFVMNFDCVAFVFKMSNCLTLVQGS